MSLTASALVMSVGGGSSSVSGLAVGILVFRFGRKRQVLLLAGAILAGTAPALLWVSSYPLLFVVFIVQSVGWSFFPVLMTIPFELRGIRPREVAIVTSSIYTIVWIGAFVGPIMTGADPGDDGKPAGRSSDRGPGAGEPYPDRSPSAQGVG